MKPMLAHKLRADKVRWPLFVQPKLNGVRALFLGVDQLQSRDGHLFSPLVVRHLLAWLNPFAGHYKLDGELYLHGMSLQQINSRIAVTRTEAHEESHLVEYHVFDVIADCSMEKRVEMLQELKYAFQDCPVKVVDTYYCTVPAEADRAFKLFKQEKYEGAIYRLKDVPYGFEEECSNQENRWWNIMKRKDWLDVDCIPIAKVEGEGRLRGMVGAFVLMTPWGKEFQAGSGMSDWQREYWWNSPKLPETVKVRYEMLSDGQVPLKPTIFLIED